MADFPTIEKTRYIEESKFTIIDEETMMFDQRSWRILNDKKGPILHVESGYIISVSEDGFELFNAQNSKRVEVMTSSELKQDSKGMSITFGSKWFGNDERMIRTTREFTVENDTLHFKMCMATKAVPEFQVHLDSVLIKH